MAVRLSLRAAGSQSYRFSRIPIHFPKPKCISRRKLYLPLPNRWPCDLKLRIGQKTKTLARLVENEGNSVSEIGHLDVEEMEKSDLLADLVAALIFSLGTSSMALVAIYCRFWFQLEEGEEMPLWELFFSFASSVGTAVGMEFWSKWVHKELWHASLWNMHKSHHISRRGQFELNDIFAVLNAVPAIALLSYGVFNNGFLPGLCFGAGLGITVLGMAYVCVHDGLIHSRFAVGPIADVPYLRRVAVAHQLHHSNKFRGVPYGFFLGPKEIEDAGGLQELDREKWEI